MRNEFSTLDIVKALGIPRERLREWINRGYVSPSVPAQGQGTKAVFTHQDVYNVQVFRELVDSGMDRFAAYACAKYYNQEMKASKNKYSYMIISIDKSKPQTKKWGSYGVKCSFAADGEKLDLDMGARENDTRYHDEKWQTIQCLNVKTLHKATDLALKTL